MNEIFRGIGAGLKPAVLPLLVVFYAIVWLCCAFPLILLFVFSLAEYPKETTWGLVAILAAWAYGSLREWQAEKGVATPFLDGVEEGVGLAFSLAYWLAAVALVVFGPFYAFRVAYLWVTHRPG